MRTASTTSPHSRIGPGGYSRAPCAEPRMYRQPGGEPCGLPATLPFKMHLYRFRAALCMFCTTYLDYFV